jgi:uncharacterized membrane protein YqjE
MATTHSARQLDLAEIERSRRVEEEGSVAELATRLAQEGVGLVAVELRRLAAEVRVRKRYAARIAGALLLGVAFASMATISLAGGVILYLGRLWGDYGAAALAVGGLLLVVALVAALVVRSAVRQIGTDDGEPEEPDGR